MRKYILFGLLPNIVNIFTRKKASKEFGNKVLYFGGCGAKVRGNKNIVKILDIYLKQPYNNYVSKIDKAMIKKENQYDNMQ